MALRHGTCERAAGERMLTDKGQVTFHGKKAKGPLREKTSYMGSLLMTDHKFQSLGQIKASTDNVWDRIEL